LTLAGKSLVPTLAHKPLTEACQVFQALLLLICHLSI